MPGPLLYQGGDPQYATGRRSFRRHVDIRLHGGRHCGREHQPGLRTYESRTIVSCMP